MDTRPKRLKTESVFALYYLLAGIAEDTRWNQRSQDCLFVVLLENLSEVRLTFEMEKKNDDDLPFINSNESFQMENPLLCLI